MPASVNSGTTCAAVPLMLIPTRKNTATSTQKRPVASTSRTVKPGIFAVVVIGPPRSPSPRRGSLIHSATAGNATTAVSNARPRYAPRQVKRSISASASCGITKPPSPTPPIAMPIASPRRRSNHAAIALA